MKNKVEALAVAMMDALKVFIFAFVFWTTIAVFWYIMFITAFAFWSAVIAVVGGLWR